MRTFRINIHYANGRHRPVLLPTDNTLWGSTQFTCSVDGSKPIKAIIPEDYASIQGLAHFVRTKTDGEVVYE